MNPASGLLWAVVGLTGAGGAALAETPATARLVPLAAHVVKTAGGQPCVCEGWSVRWTVTVAGWPVSTHWMIVPPTPKATTPTPLVPMEASGDSVAFVLATPGLWQVFITVQYSHETEVGQEYQFQLEGAVMALGGGCLFADGFERGLGAWSATTEGS